MDFVHLHTHSDYSLQKSTAQISDLVAKARKLGMKHLGLTDSGNLFGALWFEQICHSAGINPVVGCEVNVSSGGEKAFHLILYCKNEAGYRNLMILVSKGYTETYDGKPQINNSLLEAHHEGLICSTTCLKGEIPRYLLDGEYNKAREKALFYNDLFGDGNFYLELMDHGRAEEKAVNEGIKQLHKDLEIPVIATNNVHYLNKEHAKAHAVLACMESRIKLMDNKPSDSEESEQYFKTPEQMQELFADTPEALENTVKLAEKCDLTIPQPGPVLPNYKVPEPFISTADYLTDLTREGLRRRYGTLNKKIRKRMDYELGVIQSMGFENYFLIVWDYINWARQQNIPVGPGRASSPGSLVAYALMITDIDPLKYGLHFERFLNHKRNALPAIDTDFCFDRREEVIEYVYRKYGTHRVAGLSTFRTMKTREVVKEVARVLGIPLEISTAIIDQIPKGIRLPDGRSINIPTLLETESGIKEVYNRGGVYKELFDTATILEGIHRRSSTHTCGKVIANRALTDYVPLCRDQKTGEIISQYPSTIIDYCGLVRFDFLGLKTLSFLKDMEQQIRKEIPDFHMDAVPEDDAETFKMLSKGRSTGVFQFESPGMQKILKETEPETIEDLIALNALYRPGLLQHLPMFIEGKRNPESINFPVPALKELLTPSYGIFVYQEQIMEAARIIGGLSLEKGDLLRRSFKTKNTKIKTPLKVEFLSGAREKGYNIKHAEAIFNQLESSGRHCFLKSHTAAYTTIAYRTAYCKANYPAAFHAAAIHREESKTL